MTELLRFVTSIAPETESVPDNQMSQRENILCASPIVLGPQIRCLIRNRTPKGLSPLPMSFDNQSSLHQRAKERNFVNKQDINLN